LPSGPSLLEHRGHAFLRGVGKRDAHRRELLPPPLLLAGVRIALHDLADPILGQHHVHVLVVGERREDLPADPERREPMVVLLHGPLEGQRQPPHVTHADHLGAPNSRRFFDRPVQPFGHPLAKYANSRRPVPC